MKAVNRVQADNHNKLWTPGKHDVLCSKHFKVTDFIFTRHASYKLLKKGAVPSVFEWKKSNVGVYLCAPTVSIRKYFDRVHRAVSPP